MVHIFMQKCWRRRVLIYRCRHCWLPFPRFGQLLLHANQHSSRGSHECADCQKVFHSFVVYQLHGRIFHGKKWPVIGEVYDPQFVFHSGPKKCFKWQKWRSRKLAKRQTVVTRAQKLHGTKEARKQIAAAPKRSARIASKHRSADSVAVSYAVSNVKVSTEGNNELSKTSKYSCPSCSETFPVLSELKQHMTTHDDVRAFRCVQCKKEYKQKSHLVQHVRSVHKNERPHRCLQCSKRFKRRSHLVAHSGTHTRERSFQCDVCELQFAHHIQLTAHQQVLNRSVQNHNLLDITRLLCLLLKH